MISSIVRTRFAPSPTGFMHLGNIRSALYPWAFARHHNGKFILRIEDTDVKRSTKTAISAILDSMEWLGIDIDEGPFYQTDRMPRYREIIQKMLDIGKAYYCYTTNEELNLLRETQRSRGEKPRYDGRWRPEFGKKMPSKPKEVLPVVRFRNPHCGNVVWDDAVKGRIEVSNEELDDLIIARADGSPTYNFCAVVDDFDMNITHVIRGDDHINNTPRQINILNSLDAKPPIYAHLPTILDETGKKMSKRNGTMSIMEYRDAGYLPETILNYLARLGWSHGNAEIFSKEQFIQWFNLKHLGGSAAHFDPEKLRWLNNHYMKHADDNRLAMLVEPLLRDKGIKNIHQPSLTRVVALLKDRATTLRELSENAMIFYHAPSFEEQVYTKYIDDTVESALSDLTDAFEEIEWEKYAINRIIKSVIQVHNLKMAQLAMPLRILVTGSTCTPSIDAVLAVFPKNIVIERLRNSIRKKY